MAALAEGTPCWADVMVSDLDAAKRFYGELFGWTFQEGEERYGYYTDASRDGKLVAALMPKQDGRMPTVWNVYLASRDAAATAGKIEQAGGRLISEPMRVGEFGTMVIACDPGDACFGVWQPETHPGFEKRGEPGSFCWTELRTRDTERVDPFYREVFGYRTKQLGQAGGEFDYEVWSVGDSDEDTVAGRLHMGPDFPAELPAHFLLYFAVDNCDDAVATVGKLGGAVHFGPHDSPFGRIANVADDQGAVFSVIDTTARTGERPA
jgi:uncharacterized protein